MISLLAKYLNIIVYNVQNCKQYMLTYNTAVICFSFLQWQISIYLDMKPMDNNMVSISVITEILNWH